MYDQVCRWDRPDFMNGTGKLFAVAGILLVVLILCVLVVLVFAVLIVLALVVLRVLLILRVFAHDNTLLSYGNSIDRREDFIQGNKKWGWKNEKSDRFFAASIFGSYEKDGTL